jgi:hypothetical protein
MVVGLGGDCAGCAVLLLLLQEEVKGNKGRHQILKSPFFK